MLSTWSKKIRIAVAFSLSTAVLVPALSLAENVADPECVRKANIGIDSLDKILKDAGIDKNKVCKDQTKFDEAANCKNSFKQLEIREEERSGIIKSRCINQAKIAELDPNCVSDTCQTKRAGLVKWASDLNTMEQSALKQMQKYLAEVKEYQLELAKGAEEIQRDSYNKSQSEPNERTTMNIDKLGKVTGTQYQNNAQAASFFKDSLSTVSGLIQKVGNGEASASEVNALKTGLTREPLQVAMASDNWSKQMKTRQDTLAGQSAVYSAQATTGNSNASSMGSLGSAASGLGAASQAASGLGSMASSSGTAADSTQTASLSGAGATESITTVVQTGTASTGGTYAPTSMGTTALGTGGPITAGSTTPGKPDGTNGIANLETLLAKNEPGGGGLTAASSSKGSALRNSIRSKLAAIDGSAGGGAAATAGASVAPGASGSPGAGAGGVVAEAGEGAPLQDLPAADLAAGADVGNLNFSLAGGETDAAIQNMVKDFTGSSQAANRSLAAIYEQAPEILSRESASLFMRARDTHLRSLKKGLVINGLRSKL